MEILEVGSTINSYNLYCYCFNRPSTETDASGNLIASIIAKLFIGAIFGVVVQMLADFIVYLFRLLVDRKNAQFNPSAGDYIGSALTWAISFANPLGSTKKYKMLKELLNFVPLVAKYACKWIKGEEIKIYDFVTDLLAVLVSIFLSQIIDSRSAEKIKQIKKVGKNKKHSEVMKDVTLLKIKAKIMGERITITCNFTPTVLQIFYHAIVGEK